MLITVTGPESSGKTTLGRFLAESLGMKFVAEYARGYLEDRDGQYVQADLIEIARGQQSATRDAMLQNPSGVISDTGPVVLEAWSTWKYGSIDSALREVLDTFHPAIYVLCKPDIPWEFDPLRESKSQRDGLYLLYQELIGQSGVPFVIAEGMGDRRQLSVLDSIRSFVK